MPRKRNTEIRRNSRGNPWCAHCGDYVSNSTYYAHVRAHGAEVCNGISESAGLEKKQRLAVTQETSQEDEPTDDPVPGPSRVNTELNDADLEIYYHEDQHVSLDEGDELEGVEELQDEDETDVEEVEIDSEESHEEDEEDRHFATGLS
ncbi:PREDICTED: uncharacterized protein LOC109468251 [Branchiostoma belcheri]|uniref:Uncharacterized protein LOC109468251 n=1 Tax=Branchiostoma belcheri TaxID=7741 RepID=A0A6P4YTU8_BRABE|nr:PREDICTED: uncharacterized protein LOC109468251 [Branchiostoma belcheri]